jgi:uncharacterized repeat protein (TIGR02543 family)
MYNFVPKKLVVLFLLFFIASFFIKQHSLRKSSLNSHVEKETITQAPVKPPHRAPESSEPSVYVSEPLITSAQESLVKCLGADLRFSYVPQPVCEANRLFWTNVLGYFPNNPEEVINCLGADGKYSYVERQICDATNQFWATHLPITPLATGSVAAISSVASTPSLTPTPTPTSIPTSTPSPTPTPTPVPISVVTVESISPVSGYSTRQITIDSIAGSGFAAGLEVKLVRSGQDDIICTSVVLDNSTLISGAICDLTLVEAGNWSVVVTNTDTGTATLTDGFVVNNYKVGDVGPTGGYIFYVNNNYLTDGWRYLEAAPSDQSGASKWADDISTLKNALGTAIGTGKENTEAVTGSYSPIDSAIEYVNYYSNGGCDEWFLPSQQELNEMYLKLHLSGKGGFTASSYWSSSEIDNDEAYRQTFNGGAISPSGKSSTRRVRAVHRFTTCPTYSILYDGNGNTSGTAPSDNTSYWYGSSVTVLAAADLAKSNYTFTGWNTAADGGGTDYAIGDVLAMPAANLTLYAQWYTPNYSIIILPDTQSYVKDKPAVMDAQLDWIVDNKDDRNIVFVGHVGDIVQNFDLNPVLPVSWSPSQNEWPFVKEQMSKLTTAGIPYSVLPGNHDYEEYTRNSEMFNDYFEHSDFVALSDSFDTNSDNTYHLLEIDADNDSTVDDQLLILSLEFGPREAVVEWAKGVLARYSTIRTIIITHAYLQPDGDYLEPGDNHAASNGYGLGSDVNDGDELWSKLVYPYNNVVFVFCGHDGNSTDGSALVEEEHSNGNPIYQILANYQYFVANQAGELVILNFTSSEVSMRTYSPWKTTYKTDAESQADGWDWSFQSP